MVRAQLVTDWLPRKFPAALRAAVLFYAPLLLHVDHQGAGVPAFTRASLSGGRYRDGAIHAVPADQPVCEYAGETKLGLHYTVSDDLRWTSGASFTLHPLIGSVAWVWDYASPSVFWALGLTYDYSGGAGAGVLKTYTFDGLLGTETGLTEPADLHDGKLCRTKPNCHLRHVTTFTSVLTESEMVALLGMLTA